MATIDQCFRLLRYRGNKSDYLANISPDDFNLLWPQSELRFFNSKYINYGVDKKLNDTLSKVLADPLSITIDGAGKYVFPANMLHEASVTTLVGGVQQDVEEFQPDRLANKLGSFYDTPNAGYPIYVRYSNYLQFYPINLGTAILTYLKQPVSSFWAYILNGILTFNTLVGGTGYTNGGYTNVPTVGGTGSGATVDVSVIGGIVTVVTINSTGSNYTAGDTLTVVGGVIGAGSGLTFKVATTSINRPVYDPANSINPVYSDTDIDAIVYQILMDFSINTRDQEVEAFAQNQIKMES